MVRRRFLTAISLLILCFVNTISCYEKTLRKIVRNQSKMVQKPLTNNGIQTWSWSNNTGISQLSHPIITSGFIQTKTFHGINRPNMANTITSAETERGVLTHSSQLSRNSFTSDLRLTRNIIPLKDQKQLLKEDLFEKETNTKGTFLTEPSTEGKKFKVKESKFFPPVKEQELQSLEQKHSKETVFPEAEAYKDNTSFNIERDFVAQKNNSDNSDNFLNPYKFPEINSVESVNDDSTKSDYAPRDRSLNINNSFTRNASTISFICEYLKITNVDIDAQKTFSSYDVEPPYVTKKQYWNHVFESRYEALMRSVKWPPLKVILIPRSHVDSIWKKTFENYHNDSVNKILSNIVKKMHFYANMTFAWNEVSHLSEWWNNTSNKYRLGLRKLLKSGRLEITTGGWVEPDEATTYVFGLIHNFIEGHEWLKHHLNYTPEVSWLTNSVTHSPTVTYFLSTLGMSQLVLTNLHFSWEQYLAEYQYSDFLWLQSWDTDKLKINYLNDALNLIGSDRVSKYAVLTHYLQFNSAGFKACGPIKSICNDFNFAKSYKIMDVNMYNVKEKSEVLLEQYSKSGSITPHNTIIAPLGTPYAYEIQSEFDYQYKNYQTIANFVNYNQDIYKATIEFGTPKDYFKGILRKHKKYPSLIGDFLNFADINSGSPAYWTGFFTSRPFLKILLRRLEAALRTTEILFSFVLSLNAFRDFEEFNNFDKLTIARKTFARLLDRNVGSGTLPANVLRYAHLLILKTIKDCWQMQEVATSFLLSKSGYEKLYLKKYVYKEGELIASFKTVSPEDQIFVFNSLTQERTEVIQLVSTHPNVRVVDYNRKEVTVQINPIWKYSQKQIMISRRYFKITFVVTILPMTLQLYKIKETYQSGLSAATLYCSSCKVNEVPGIKSTFPFKLKPIQTGDIQIESYKHRLIFDELSGFLKTIVDKQTNIAKNVMINFGAFNDADVNSGMYLFRANDSVPIIDILKPYYVGSKLKTTIIISGQLTTEISSVFGRFLEHSLTIYNLANSPLSNAIRIVNRVDYEISPKNRDLELFMTIQTDISNGAMPQIYIDNNGFQHTGRTLNLSNPIESNMYPVTSIAYIEDRRSRLTFITDHAQAITAMQEGQLLIVLDRRILFDDGRGAKEGLADNTVTSQNMFLLLENFRDTRNAEVKNDLSVPSATAVHLANILNYLPDTFLAQQNGSKIGYGILPLIKTPFPCDISVINFRLVLSKEHREMTPNTALLVLHRHYYSCNMENSLNNHCHEVNEIYFTNIFRTVRAVYRTNLAGTNKGELLLSGSFNFPPMEIVTFKLYF